MMVLDAVTLMLLCLTLYFVCRGWDGMADGPLSGWLVLYGLLVFGFTAALDAYKPHVCRLYEKGLTFVLASVYAGIVAGLAGIFCLPGAPVGRLCTACCTVSAAGLIAENAVVPLLLRKMSLFRKPKLLILSQEADDPRALRLRQDVTGYCDAQCAVPDELPPLLDRFDAICLMESILEPQRSMLAEQARARGLEIRAVPQMPETCHNCRGFLPLGDMVTLPLPLAQDGRRDGILPTQLPLMSRIVKRATDVAVAAAGLIVFAVPMAVIAVAIKATSPGDVLYRQVRLTKDKREFIIIKFRTMVQDAEASTGPVMARKDDARITPLGRWLRACRLDELPQLFNILKGEMSVVGPRPERPFFVKQNEAAYPLYDCRFAVKAGLTGLSHVYGRYSTRPYDRTCFDLMYIAHHSWLRDMKILLLTSKVMFLRSAAEGEDMVG